ncbi:hypothetical protein L6164_004261 [Bauhinia variegata]|uniref:Uncharacterized protein n=1 Tax=Bauhinia variegata TaxID=167791 RepID=A0ACB9Q3E2_BAUVA|nr:hypothetical protein L6164_004261 [Bauhinia variegata]
MASGAKVEGGTQILPARVRKTIQSIKEIVRDHSDADIYYALKETNMDPNETAQILLNQDPFHEVKRRRDRKKEPKSVGYKGSTDQRRRSENINQGTRFQASFDHNVRRPSHARNSFSGSSPEFRVVRDNRVNRNIHKEAKPSSLQCTTATNEQLVLNTSEKGTSAASINQRPFGARNSNQASNGPLDSHARYSGDGVSNGSNKKAASEVKQVLTLNSAVQLQPSKPINVNQNSATLASTSSAVGVYSSSTDPVHVPSPDSRSSGTVGAIRREVGVVGVRRPSDNSVNKPSIPSTYSNPLEEKDGTSRDSFQSLDSISKADQLSQTNVTEPSLHGMPVSRQFLNNQHNSRPHQQLAGHQRVSQPNKEWKPKSSKKSSGNSPGVIGTPKKPASPPEENSKVVESDTSKLRDKFSQVNRYDNQNVIIAQHIRVPETDRCQLTFGTIGAERDSSRHQSKLRTVGTAKKSNEDSSASLSVAVPESSSDDVSASKQVGLLDDHIGNTGSDSPASVSASEQQLPDNKESSSPQNLDNYADIGLVRDSSPTYAPSEPQQQQDSHDMPGFSAYDPPNGYDMPYFRPTVDETVRGHGLPSSQEGLSSYVAKSIPASTISSVQQQQPVAQMYPQVHVSHFANLVPFRQFLSPVYVPPMPMPGYSSNPPYAHPSNGSSYLLMPGGSSHLNANSLTYGVQQYKPVPAGSPTGFGNFPNPTGYAMNAPGVVGGATTLEDSSRIKYKESNLYVPNPQAETSEIWIQNPRELPGMQSTPYYNLPAQTPHAAYMPSPTGHGSFNAAAAQSSHLQFPGMYHAPPQPAGIASPHHLGPAMGNNVGVGMAAAAPGAQVGAYQQPQLGHLNWTTNF